MISVIMALIFCSNNLLPLANIEKATVVVVVQKTGAVIGVVVQESCCARNCDTGVFRELFELC